MIKRFIGRFLCLFFGHAPSPVTFTFPDGRPPEHGDLQIITIGNGPQTVAVCFNVCLRCDEPARHRTREAIMTEKIRGLIAGEAKGKADVLEAQRLSKADAWAKRQRGETLSTYATRIKSPNPFGTTSEKPKLAAVPEPAPEPK